MRPREMETSGFVSPLRWICALALVGLLAFGNVAGAQRSKKKKGGFSRGSVQGGARVQPVDPDPRGPGDPRGPADPRGALDPRGVRDPRGVADPRGRADPRGPYDPRGRYDPRGPYDPRHYGWHDDWEDWWDDDDAPVGAILLLGVVIGAVIASLPDDNEPVSSAGQTYHYSNGVYYQQAPSGSGYTVVQAPVGATVSSLPPSAENVYVGDEVYVYANGAFYQKNPAQEEERPTYTVIGPPFGAAVSSLPEGSETTTVGGQQYFVYAGTYYRPFYSGGDVVYVVADNPNV